MSMNAVAPTTTSHSTRAHKGMPFEFWTGSPAFSAWLFKPGRSWCQDGIKTNHHLYRRQSRLLPGWGQRVNPMNWAIKENASSF